jgi:hypothetical protein
MKKDLLNKRTWVYQRVIVAYNIGHAYVLGFTLYVYVLGVMYMC